MIELNRNCLAGLRPIVYDRRYSLDFACKRQRRMADPIRVLRKFEGIIGPPG